MDVLEHEGVPDLRSLYLYILNNIVRSCNVSQAATFRGCSKSSIGQLNHYSSRDLATSNKHCRNGCDWAGDSINYSYNYPLADQVLKGSS